MFRKPVHTSQAHLVSGADRKKLRKALDKQLGGADEELLDALLPLKAGDLQQAKLGPPARGNVFTLDGVPLLFDASGKGDLYVPTAMGLWRAQGLLPRLPLKHPAVSQFICGSGHGHAADLMLPGVDAARLPAFAKGDLVAVVVPGNPAPIAVGIALMASGDMRDAGATSGKGRAVEVLQAYGDHLWADTPGKPTPNEGFGEGIVGPLPGADSGGSGGGSGDGSRPAVGAAAEVLGESAGPPAASPDTAGVAMEASAGPEGRADRQAAPANGSGEAAVGGEGGRQVAPQPGDDAAAAAGGAPVPSGATPEAPVDMDVLLEAALLQALHRSVKDGDLPMAGSALWSQHMLPNRPPGSTLDVKKSKHKKIPKLLQVYAKAGLLAGKEDKAGGDFIVSGVNRRHALYEDFRPYHAAGQPAVPQQGGGAVTSSGGGGGMAGASSCGTASGGGGGGGGEELVIAEVFKPTRELKPVFEAVGVDVDALYSAHNALEVAAAYIKAAKLEEGAPDNRTLVLDAVLCDGLFKGLIKKGETFPTHLAKAQLREKFLGRMQAQYLVQRGQQRAVRKGAPPPVHVSTEKRQGNKRVTKVVGLEAYLVDVEACAAELRSKLACSTSVAELPGKNQGHEVVCQGAVIDKVADHLITMYGIPKKVILTKAI